MPLNRRRLLQFIAAGSTGLYAGMAGLPFFPRAQVAHASPAEDAYCHFPQGVASGDPQPDAIMLWTRVEKPSDLKAPIDLVVQLSSTPDFQTVIIERILRAEIESDHTVRFLAEGLEPDTPYFYRFIADNNTHHTVGRTRTAPAPGTDRDIRFAYASCQGYEAGFYGAWRTLVEEDKKRAPEEQLDFILHLGDFIYEMVGDVPPERQPARNIPPFPDGSEKFPSGTKSYWQADAQYAVTLADYRHLYKIYLSDPDLQAARARFPFVCTWDDHEFTNNGWQSHGTYFGDGQPAQQRKVAANQSWFEFIPCILTADFKKTNVSNADMGAPDTSLLHQGSDNISALESLTIYRKQSWGERLDLVITDTRSYRSQPVLTQEVKELIKGAPIPPIRLVRELDAGKTAHDGSPNGELIYGDARLPNPRKDSPPGTCLGAVQKEWFKETMARSKAKWRIWGNSIPMVSLRLDMDNMPFTDFEAGYIGTDAWQGFPSEASELVTFLQTHAITNTISCAGDHHTFAAGRIPIDLDGTDYALPEFAVGAISSGDMFTGAERSTRVNETFHKVAQFSSDNGPIVNWDNTLLNGIRSALLAAYTGSISMAKWVANGKANPGLSFIDSQGHGFATVHVKSDDVVITFINVGDITRDAGPNGKPILRATQFSVPAWSKGETPQISKPETVIGTPNFAFSD